MRAAYGTAKREVVVASMGDEARAGDEADHFSFVWNPWDKKAKALTDFGHDEYKHMLCVEAAAIEKPITLKPGEEWRGRQELLAVPSSYCSGQLDPRKVLQGI